MEKIDILKASDYFKANINLLIIFSFILTFSLISAYSIFQSQSGGLKLIYGDSYIYLEMARRIAYTHQLYWGNFNSLIYPPIYPLILSPAYYFEDPQNIFLAVRWINIFIYSLVFFPIFGLLRSYANLKLPESLIGGILFSCLPYSIEYSITVMSETVYIPMLISVFYLAHKGWFYKTKLKSIIFGIILAILPLIKDLGYVIVLAFELTFIFYYIIQIKNYKVKNKLNLANVLLAFIAGFLVLLSTKLYIHIINPGMSLTVLGLKDINFIPLKNPFYWFDSIKTHYVFLNSASFSMLGLLTIISFFSRKKNEFMKNFIFEISLIFSILGTLIVIPLFMATFFPSNYLNDRYIVPFIFLFILPGLKYYNNFYNKKIFWFIITSLIVFYISSNYLNLSKLLKLSQQNNQIPSANFIKETFSTLIIISTSILLYLKKNFFIRYQYIFLLCLYITLNIVRGGHALSVDKFIDQEGNAMPKGTEGIKFP